MLMFLWEFDRVRFFLAGYDATEEEATTLRGALAVCDRVAFVSLPADL